MFKCPKDCNKKEKKCCGISKIVIPAALGDDTGEFKPENGAYHNTLVKYEENGALYLYSNDGIYTKVGEPIGDAILTIKQGDTTLGTFSANASDNVEINVGDIYEITTIEGESDYYEVYKNGVLIDDPAEAYRAIFEDAAPQEIRWRENPGAVCYHKCLGTVLNFIGGNGSGSDECGYEARIYSLALNSDGTFSVSAGEPTFKTNLELRWLYSGEDFLPNGTYAVESENPVYGDSGTNYYKLNRYFLQSGSRGNVVLSVAYEQSGHRLVLGDINYDTENSQTVLRMELMNVSRQEIYSIIFRSDSTYTVTNRYRITTTDLMGS